MTRYFVRFKFVRTGHVIDQAFGTMTEREIMIITLASTAVVLDTWEA
jgi:hypothetical protein